MNLKQKKYNLDTLIYIAFITVLISAALTQIYWFDQLANFRARTAIGFLLGAISFLFLGYRLRDSLLASEFEEKSQDLIDMSIELNNVKQKLFEATEEIQNLSTIVARKDASLETLEGKARTTALQLIGGLVMIGYKLDIHAKRLSGVTEVVADFAKLNIKITDETLSKWIKDSAELIEKPKS